MNGNEQGAQWRMIRLYVELPFTERKTHDMEVLREFQRWIASGKRQSTLKEAIGTPKIRKIRRVKAMTTDQIIIEEGEINDQE